MAGNGHEIRVRHPKPERMDPTERMERMDPTERMEQIRIMERADQFKDYKTRGEKPWDRNVKEDTFGSAEAIEKTAASEQQPEEKILNEKIKVMERLLNEAQEARNLGMVDYFRDRIAEFRGELNEISAKKPEEASDLEAQSKIEKFSRLQQEAKTEGNTAMADYYGGLIKDIRDAIKGRPPRPVATGHQGRQEEDPENLGYHQGRQTEQISKPGEMTARASEKTKTATELRNQFRNAGEISFGSSDVKKAQDKMKSAGGKVDTFQKHLQSDISFNRDMSKSKLDLKYAQKQYAAAVKEYNEAVAESEKD